MRPIEPVTFISLLRNAPDAPRLAELVTRLASHPDPAEGLLGLSTVLQYLGRIEDGLEMQDKALALRQHYRVIQRKSLKGPRLLALMVPGEYLMANTPLEFLLENADVRLELIFVTPEAPLPERLPEHDILFVAIGHAEPTRSTLHSIQSRLRNHTGKVVNRPDALLGLSRERVSERLQDMPDCIVPRVVRMSREALTQLAQSNLGSDTPGDFPLIVRPLDSHAGKGLCKLTDRDGLRDYLASRTAAWFLVARYIEYRHPDGRFRKYRIALIDRQPYLCHLAISDHWIVNYENSGMHDSTEKRAEEARELQEPESGFLGRHAGKLREIADRLELDYVVVDCAETADRQFLFFEADNRGFVHATDPEDLFPYKRRQMDKVFAAFRDLVAHTTR